MSAELPHEENHGESEATSGAPCDPHVLSDREIGFLERLASEFVSLNLAKDYCENFAKSQGFKTIQDHCKWERDGVHIVLCSRSGKQRSNATRGALVPDLKKRKTSSMKCNCEWYDLNLFSFFLLQYDNVFQANPVQKSPARVRSCDLRPLGGRQV